MRRLIVLAAIAAVLIGGAACGGGSSPGMLVFGQSNGIVEYDLRDGTQALLLAPVGGNGVVLRDPTISPDGKRVAYVHAFPLKSSPDRTFEASTDLWVANRDGSDAHLAFAHDTSNQRVLYPRWLDNQHVLGVVRVAPNANIDIDAVLTLERIDVGTGERMKLAENVTDFGLSADQERIVYGQIAGVSYVLMIGDIDAASGAITNEQVLVGGDQRLGPLLSPRFSPDGKTIAFASPEPASATAVAHERYVTVSRSGPSAVPPLQGLPQDIWTIDASGGSPRRLADVKLDDPALAYSADGARLYILSFTSLDEMELKSGAMRHLADNTTFRSQLIWVK